LFNFFVRRRALSTHAKSSGVHRTSTGTIASDAPSNSKNNWCLVIFLYFVYFCLLSSILYFLDLVYFWPSSLDSSAPTTVASPDQLFPDRYRRPTRTRHRSPPVPTRSRGFIADPSDLGRLNRAVRNTSLPRPSKFKTPTTGPETSHPPHLPADKSSIYRSYFGPIRTPFRSFNPPWWS
jgi:hypothetical protein